MKFRPIPFFPGYYVSSCGLVLSTRLGKRKILVRCISTTGYLAVNLYRADGGHKYAKVHQLVALVWKGPRPKGHCVNHKDGNKQNPDVNNLEYVTFQGNLAHAFSTGLRIPSRGSKHHWAKLKDQDVREIRMLVLSGKDQTSVAKLYNVNSSCISDIVTRKTWKSI